MKNYLIALYDEFKKTDDVYVRGYIWSILSNFAKYCDSDEEIKKMFNDVSLACQYIRASIRDNELLTLKKEKEFLMDNSEFIAGIPSEIYLYDSNFDRKKHSMAGLYSVLESFLYSVSSEIFDFYQELRKSGRIVILNKGNSNGYTGYASVDNSDSFICINKFETFEDLKVLVHELGHAYYSYCNGITLEDTKDLSLMIKSEIPAIWLEMLFHVYLRNYHNIKIKKRRIKSFEDFMNYFGLYATSYLRIGNQDRNLEDMFKYIYETDYHDLIHPMRKRNLTK